MDNSLAREALPDGAPGRRRFLRATAAMAAGSLLAPAALAAEPGTQPPGRRIGFVDYRLDNYHANTFLAAIRGPLAARGFTVTGALALEEGGAAWASKNGVPYFTDPAALNEVVDYYMVLAPSNPEVHLELSRLVLPFGKPTYVDKTFAPDLATATEIFALADRYGAPLQTSSALRYTDVQRHVREVGPSKVRHMVAWGGGSSFGEYAIHPLELVVSAMGPEVESMMRRGTGDQSQLLLDFSGGRTAVVNVYAKTSTPFAASVTTEEGTRYIQVDNGPLFVDTAAGILDFFEAGRALVDRRETLTIMRVLDGARHPAVLGCFVPLS